MTHQRRLIAALTLLILLSVGASGQDEPSLVRVFSSGNLGIPIGETQDRYANRFGAGASVTIIPANRGYLGFVVAVDYQQAAIAVDNVLTDQEPYTLRIVRPEAGLQARFRFTDGIAAYLQGTAGYGLADLIPQPYFRESPVQASGFSYRGGVGIELVLNNLVVTLDGSWDSLPGIYDGFTGRVGVGWQTGGLGTRGTSEPVPLIPTLMNTFLGGRANVVFSNLEVDPIFPSLYKYYDTNPIGRVTITNKGSTTIESIEVVLAMDRFIDSPKVSGRVDSLEPDESREVELLALFDQSVLEITEGDKVGGAVRATFVLDGRDQSDEEPVTVDFYDRNAIRWDDDNKVGAFVTPRDEELLPFARNLASVARQNRQEAVSSNLQTAMVMFLGMVNQGLSYIIDPNSAYEVLSENPLAIDSVQFPRQTLAYRAGDCDDLSVTLASMLESVGVATAFLTYPGHIFMAFQLDMSPREAQSTFARPEDLIFRDDGTVWIPFESTLLESSFVEAWASGAQQWREYDGPGLASFYPTQGAWATYSPVEYNGDEQIGILDLGLVATEFSDHLQSYIRREISGREEQILEQLARSPDNPRLLNRLGVLYARYGLNAEAEAALIQAVEAAEYAPSLANLGNLAFLAGEFERADDYFTGALQSDPSNDAALLGLARTSHELENYGTVGEYYEQLQERNPDLAARFSYLALRGDEASRASDAANLGGRAFWSEEIE